MTGLLVDRVQRGAARCATTDLRPPTGRDAGTVAALAPQGDRFVSVFDVDRVLDLGVGA